MTNYIQAVEEIFGKHIYQHTYALMHSTQFSRKGIEVWLQDYGDDISIFTSKKRNGILTTEKEFSVYKITESQLPLAMRSIVRFWAKNGVKLNEAKLGGEGK